MGTYARILSRVTLDTREFNSGLTRLQRDAARAVRQMNDIGARLTNSFTLPAIVGGGLSLNAYAEYDALTKALSTQEKTAEGLKNRLEELRNIAKAPGIGFQEAIQGDVRLRAVGISAEQSAKILKEFANAIAQTGGGKAELNSVTVQLGQLAAKGKVFAQDLKPIIEAAPVVGQALSNMFGTVDSESIQKQLATAGKDSKQFINDLLAELSKAPRVGGGFKNAVENMRDALFQFGASIGMSIDKSFNLTDRLQALSERIITLGRDFNNLPPSLQKFIIGTAGATAAAGPFLSILGKVGELFTGGSSLTRGVGILKSLGKGLLENKRAAAGWAAAILVGYEVIKNLTPELGQWRKEFENLYQTSTSFKNIVDYVVQIGKNLGFVFNVLGDIVSFVGGAFTQVFRDVKNLIISAFGGNADFGKDRFKEAGKALDGLTLTIYKATGAYIKFTEAQKPVSTQQITDNITKLKDSMVSLNTAAKNQTNLTDRLVPKITQITEKTDKYAEIIKKLGNELGQIKSKVTILGEDAIGLEQSAIKSAINGILDLENGTTRYAKKLDDLGNRLATLNGQAAAQDFTKTINEGAKAGILILDSYGLAANEVSNRVNAMKTALNAVSGIFAPQAGGFLGAINEEISSGAALVDSYGVSSERANQKIDLMNDALKEAMTVLPSNNKAMVALKSAIDQTTNSLTVQIKGWKGLIEGNQVKEWVDETGKSFESFAERLKATALEKMGKDIERLKGSMKSLGNDTENIFEKIGKALNIPESALGRFADTVGFTISAIGNIFSQNFENRKSALDNYYTKEQERINQSRMNEEQKQAALLKLENDVSRKKRKIQHDEAKAAKRRAIFEATIAGATAVVNALKIPPPLGQIFAGIVGGLAAVQIGAIASAPLPALAKGGLAYGPTTALVGDNRNAGVDPEVIAPLSKLESIMGGARYVPEVTIRNGDIKIVSDYNVMLDKRLRGA